ncbi:MAG: hypothetical protein EPO20_08060 [Betaproteobacteria bacterium]|nr:MAG: hypothetical protein EPO20_08060 [Betaproteobacteria bacterium]
MSTTRKVFFQPGWATPMVIDYGNPSFLAWFLRFRDSRKHCLARRQGKCPGRDQCHDCAWSSKEA